MLIEYSVLSTNVSCNTMRSELQPPLRSITRCNTLYEIATSDRKCNAKP